MTEGTTTSDGLKEDRFKELRRRIEEGPPRDHHRGISPLWLCPRCGSAELMLHVPVWLTASVDQQREADLPALDSDQDIYEQIRGLPTEYECCDCHGKFLQLDRAGRTPADD